MLISARFAGWLLLVGLTFLALMRDAAAQNVGLNAPLELVDQVDLGQADPRVVSSMQRFEQLLEQEQWEDAMDTVMEIDANWGDALWRSERVQQPPGFETHLPLRLHLLIRLSQLHRQAPQALATYRRRNEALVERWFEEAAQSDDPQSWRRIVDQGWLSKRGDDALWRLGEFELQHGRFSAARRAWEQLHPALRTPPPLVALGNAWAGRPLWLGLIDAPLAQEAWEILRTYPSSADAPPDWLAFPDTDLDLAQIRARLALVSILEGSLERAEVELEILRRLHPEATGVLGGRSATWTTLLDSLLSEARSWGPARPVLTDWPTFAGDAQRAGQFASQDFDPSFAPRWTVDLQAIAVAEDARSIGSLRPGEGQVQGLAYHPIVIGSTVAVAQPHSIRLLDLETGKAAFSSISAQTGYLQGEVYRAPEPPITWHEPSLGSPCFTLTAEHQCVYARAGDPHTAWRTAMRDPPQSLIVGLDLAAQGRMLQGFPLAPPPGWIWEGSPIVADHRLLASMRRQEPLSAELAVACHDAHSGETIWTTTVVSAPPLGKGRWNEITHHLLAYHDGVVYYNTHHGAVAALDAIDGRVLWVCRYPRTQLRADQPDQYLGFLMRDLTPCLFWRDLVFAAPSDSDRLFAIDVATGRVQWCSPPGQGADVVHLLGVAGNQLVASGDHLYWWNAQTGNLEGQFPAPQREAPGHGLREPKGHGRGLVANGRVYWPTKDALYVFQANTEPTSTGWRPVLQRTPIDLAARGAGGGNLIPAGSWLLIASETKLYAFHE